MTLHNKDCNKEYVTYEQQYLKLVSDILDQEQTTTNRTGISTLKVIGGMIKVDLQKEFPLLTTKKMGVKSIFGELLWFLSGSCSAETLREKYNCSIWDEWQDADGNLGLLYGHQWRNFNGDYVMQEDGLYPRGIKGTGYDQISKVVELIKTDPDSRRIIISSWDPVVSHDTALTALPACHPYVQFIVQNGQLHCLFVMRSNDLPLGNPYNIASYALLTHMLASVCDLEVGTLTYFGTDIHIYENQIEVMKEQLTRTPYTPPRIALVKRESIFEYELSDVTLVDYTSHPALPMTVAV